MHTKCTTHLTLSLHSLQSYLVRLGRAPQIFAGAPPEQLRRRSFAAVDNCRRAQKTIKGQPPLVSFTLTFTSIRSTPPPSFPSSSMVAAHLNATSMRLQASSEVSLHNRIQGGSLVRVSARVDTACIYSLLTYTANAFIGGKTHTFPLTRSFSQYGQDGTPINTLRVHHCTFLDVYNNSGVKIGSHPFFLTTSIGGRFHALVGDGFASSFRFGMDWSLGHLSVHLLQRPAPPVPGPVPATLKRTREAAAPSPPAVHAAEEELQGAKRIKREE